MKRIEEYLAAYSEVPILLIAQLKTQLGFQN